MKSIVFIITTLRRTGPVNILFDLIRYLDRSVYTPYVITLCDEEGDSRWGEFEAEGLSLVCLHLPKGLRFIASSARIKSVVDRIRPTVVHCHGFRADLLGAVFLGRYKKVSSQHNYPFDDYVLTYGKLAGGLMAHLTAWALRRYDFTIACANHIAIKFRRNHLQAIYINNGIDDAFFSRPLPHVRDENRKILNISPNTKFVFIFVGVLSERKQPLVALQAFLQFQVDYPESMLLVLGDGPLSGLCKQLTEGRRVVFFGNVSDIRPYLVASDAYLATSKAEGMPVSVLEAMSMRIPVVLSDIEPHREILAINSEAGFLAKTGSIDDTAQTMRRLAMQNLETMGNHSRHIIDLEFNARVMSGKFQGFYSKLTN